MEYGQRLETGTFVRRYKRFFCDVRLDDGSVITAHLANTGKMTACTAPDAPVRLSRSDNPKRKLRYSVEQIQVGGHWICVNSARPNRVVEEGIRNEVVPELAGFAGIERERKLGESRVDLKLSEPGIVWVEVKNATFLVGEELRFPDAVTVRGTRHVQELEAAVRGGDRAVLFFHVGHEGGSVVALAESVDPAYAAAVRSAVAAGVEVLAYRAALSDSSITLTSPVPLAL